MSYKGEDVKKVLLNKVLTRYSNDDIGEDFRKLIEENNPEFVMKTAIYIKENHNMRKVPIVLLVELANIRGIKGLKKVIPRVIRRADEITFALEYQLDVFGKPIPSSLRKGLANSFNNFNRYEFAKYKNAGGTVRMKDALFLCHPKPKDKEKEKLFMEIAEDKLETPKTWETIVSEKGSTKEAWEEALKSMGYMALIRNLNNLIKVGVKIPYEKICDPVEVLKSKQTPFRFFSAYKNMISDGIASDAALVREALDKALDLSTENLAKFDGKNAVLCDVSGSMDNKVNDKSSMTLKEIACLLGAVLFKGGNTEVISFADSADSVQLDKKARIIENTKSILGKRLGCSTYGWKAIDVLLDNKIVVDRIFLLSDMMLHGERRFEEEYKKYKELINKNVKLYAIDLSGNGNYEVKSEETLELSGWNENIFEMVKDLERGESIIKNIDNIVV